MFRAAVRCAPAVRPSGRPGDRQADQYRTLIAAGVMGLPSPEIAI